MSLLFFLAQLPSATQLCLNSPAQMVARARLGVCEGAAALWRLIAQDWWGDRAPPVLAIFHYFMIWE